MSILSVKQTPCITPDRLLELREEIDRVDQAIIQLIKERKEIVSQVMEWKVSCGYPVYDPEREIKIIEKLQHMAEDANIDPEFISNVYQEILRDSKKKYL